MRKNLLALFLVITFILPSAALAQTAVKITAQERQMATAITAAQLKDYLYFVASDEMEGRDTPSRGLDLTAKFIATLLSRWGVKPAGDDGTYFQKIALLRSQADPSKAQIEIGGQKLNYGTDYFSDASTGAVTNAPIVFAGNGWYVKARNIDAYKDLDVRGKTVVVYSENFPRGFNSFQELQATGRYGVDWIDPVRYARQKGAAALIMLATPTTQNNWQQIRQQRERGSNLTVEKLREPRKTAQMPLIFLSRPAADVLFRGESSDLAKITEAEATDSFPPFTFNKQINIDVATKNEVVYTQNVVALWEGSDAILKNEMVAIGAHYDHDGVNPNARGEDKIWNGADDDGSGTVAVLAIAEALAKAKQRPKRSVLFVWHAGEEKGLWGSEYFNKFPTVNIKNVIAQLNIDMIGRSRKPGDTNPKNAELSDENTIYVIGAEMMSSTLGTVTKGTNNQYLNMTYDYKYDDPKDKNQFFFRSDHFNYAVNGIPVAFWFNGVHEDYHQPGDEPDKIDYAKMEKVTRTIFLTLWELASLRTRPTVDKQLPPELMQR